MYKYGLKCSDEQFKRIRRKFLLWLGDYRTCEYDEPNDDGEYETYDSLESAYDDCYDSVDSLYEDTAEAAFFKGFRLALDMTNTMQTE